MRGGGVQAVQIPFEGRDAKLAPENLKLKKKVIDVYPTISDFFPATHTEDDGRGETFTIQAPPDLQTMTWLELYKYVQSQDKTYQESIVTKFSETFPLPKG